MALKSKDDIVNERVNKMFSLDEKLKQYYPDSPENEKFRAELLRGDAFDAEAVLDVVESGADPQEVKQEYLNQINSGAFSNQISAKRYMDENYQEPKEWTPITDALETIVTDAQPLVADAGQFALKVARHPATKVTAGGVLLLGIAAGCAISKDLQKDQNSGLIVDQNGNPIYHQPTLVQDNPVPQDAPAMMSNNQTQEKHFNGLYSRRNPSFAELGAAVSQLHNNQFLRGRVVLPFNHFLSESAFNLNALATYFRDTDGQYEMPHGVALSQFLGYNFSNGKPKDGHTLPNTVAVLGLFADFNQADFENAFTRDQYEVKGGFKMLAMHDLAQLVFKAGGVHKNSDYNYDLTGQLNGGFFDIQASFDFGYGFALTTALGFSDSSGSIRDNNNTKIDVDTSLVYGGLAFAFSPSDALQFNLHGNLTHTDTEYSDNSNIPRMKKDQWEIGGGVKAYPLRLFGFDRESGLYKSLGDFYFFFSGFGRFDQDNPYRRQDGGISGGLGLEF